MARSYRKDLARYLGIFEVLLRIFHVGLETVYESKESRIFWILEVNEPIIMYALVEELTLSLRLLSWA